MSETEHGFCRRRFFRSHWRAGAAIVLGASAFSFLSHACARDEAATDEATTALLPLALGSVVRPLRLSYRTWIVADGSDFYVDEASLIEHGVLGGTRVIRVVGTAQSGDNSVTDTLYADATDLVPINRTFVFDNGRTIVLAYADTLVTAAERFEGDTRSSSVELPGRVFADGAGLELAISGLPLREGYETLLRTIASGALGVRHWRLSVAGSESVSCGAGSFAAFVVHLRPLDGEDTGTIVYRVARDSPHFVVLKRQELPAAAGGGEAHTELISLEWLDQ